MMDRKYEIPSTLDPYSISIRHYRLCRVAQGVAKGTAAGAGIGAIGGAIDGDVGRTAANGALYGATRSGLDADREKQRVFKRCLRGRGYRVLN